MMPVYVWVCRGCGWGFELRMRLAEYEEKLNEQPMCPRCMGKMERDLSGVGFALKGSGWPGKANIRGKENKDVAARMDARRKRDGK